MLSFLYTMITGGFVLGVFMLVGSWHNQRKRLRAPRITAAELDALQARLAAATLPVVRVNLTPDPSFSPTASRVGGHPFADSPRRKWPVRGKDQTPMLFVAQINFAEVPPIEDFPTKGLLQLFALTDERGHLQGTDRKSDRVIRWYPDATGTLTLTPPDVLTNPRKRGAFSQRAIRDGLGMQFALGEAEADPFNWPYHEKFPDLNRRLPENEDVERRLTIWEKENEDRVEQDDGRHWIGGHPQFVQEDIRYEPRLRKLNRVLLHLASDDTHICIGDAGVLNLMISRKDLRNADFDQAFCTWDCS